MDTFSIPFSVDHKDDWDLCLIGTLLLTFFFTHAGDYETPFGLHFFLIDYYILLGVNFIVILFIWRFVRWLAIKKTQWWIGVAVPYSLVFFDEIFRQLTIPSHEFDAVDFFSIVLPFSFVIILGVNLYYRQYAFGKKEENESTPSMRLLSDNLAPVKSENQKVKEAKILLPKVGGKKMLELDKIGGVVLGEVSTRILLNCGGTEVTTETISGIQKMLLEKEEEAFFVMNRRAVLHRSFIQSYVTKTDGRIEAFYPSGSTIVSKNKAASFKRWWENAAELSPSVR